MTRIFALLFTALVIVSMCFALPVPSNRSGRVSRSPPSLPSYVEGQWRNFGSSNTPSPAQYNPPSPPLEPLGGDYKIPLEEYDSDYSTDSFGEGSGRRSRSRSPHRVPIKQFSNPSQVDDPAPSTSRSNVESLPTRWRESIPSGRLSQITIPLAAMYNKRPEDALKWLDDACATKEDGKHLWNVRNNPPKLKAAYIAIRYRQYRAITRG